MGSTVEARNERGYDLGDVEDGVGVLAVEAIEPRWLDRGERPPRKVMTWSF